MAATLLVIDNTIRELLTNSGTRDTFLNDTLTGNTTALKGWAAGKNYDPRQQDEFSSRAASIAAGWLVFDAWLSQVSASVMSCRPPYGPNSAFSMPNTPTLSTYWNANSNPVAPLLEQSLNEGAASDAYVRNQLQGIADTLTAPGQAAEKAAIEWLKNNLR